MAYIPAAAAAAEKRRQMRRLAEEEEDMTRYTQDDLGNDWEFKIVRSDTASFRKPEALKKLLEEEAQTGWVMLEKFDDGRVRFKRSRSARSRDALLPPGTDPYRTQYGISSARIGLTVVALMMLALLALGALGFWFFVVR